MFKGTGIKEKVIGEIRELAIVYRMDKVVLFGFRARSDFRKRHRITENDHQDSLSGRHD